MIGSKKHKVALASLITASAVSLSAAAFMLVGGTQTAYAARTPIQLDGSTIFYTELRGAEITYSPQETVEVEGTESKHSYAMFSIQGDEKVDMRNNLAYSWISNKKNAENDYTAEGKEGKFSMVLGFPEAKFSRYIVKFQSQQFVYTEDKVSDNYLVFTSVGEGTELQLAITDSLDDVESNNLGTNFYLGQHIKIEFGDYENGAYDILVNGTETGKQFKNVTEYYAEYVSSSTASVTPISFSAEFAEGADAGTEAGMVLYSLNGQSFELETKSLDSNGNEQKDADGNVIYEVKVVDDVAPVVCFTQTPSYVEYGKNLSLSYKAIDVLTKSPRTTAYYYVLSGEQYGKDDFDYDKFIYDVSADSPFTENKTNARIIRDTDTFIPTLDGEMAEDIYGLVKVYIKASDDSLSSSPVDYVFADWYAKKDSLVDIYELKNKISGGSSSTDKHSYFLKLIDEKGKQGATYADAAYLDLDDYAGVDVLERYKDTVASLQQAYQTAIDDYIASLKDEDGNVVGKLYAGGDSKFYLPSIQPALKQVYGGDGMNLFDDFCSITDYTYVIYYKGNGTDSTQALDFNKLAISLSDANTSYRFTIYVNDPFTNAMRYPAGVEDGKIVWKTIDKSDVWNSEYDDLLPRFSFPVYYKEATSSNPESLSLSYVGTTYNGVSFDIKGVSGTYTTSYKLYVFDRNAMYDETQRNIAYEQFNKEFEQLFASEATRKYFTTVKPASELLETDDNYKLFKEINWSDSNVTFVPQSVEDFYVVELTLTDNQTQASSRYYTAIAPSKATTPLKGESEWVQNNIVSIVLLSVAGACLIALVLLFILKPKDKGDIDTVYIQEEEKKAAKSQKKNNKKKA